MVPKKTAAAFLNLYGGERRHRKGLRVIQLTNVLIKCIFDSNLKREYILFL